MKAMLSYSTQISCALVSLRENMRGKAPGVKPSAKQNKGKLYKIKAFKKILELIFLSFSKYMSHSEAASEPPIGNAVE